MKHIVVTALLPIALFVSAAMLVSCASKIEHVEPKPNNVYKTPANQNLVEHMIFFAFDNAILPADITSILEPHAKHLISNPSRRVFIDGLADERGDYHYNYVLGLKRADAVSTVLLQLGVDKSQLIVHSTGIERSLNAKSHERNRRVVLAY